MREAILPETERAGTRSIPVPSPRMLRERLPLDAAAADTVRRTRHAIRALLHGRDRRRQLVIVGPCSIHDPAAAFEYAERLHAIAEATREQLVVVMRTYLEKPRTCLGWKGLLNDPDLDGSHDIAAGLEHGRRLLLALNRRGVACGSELLDPTTPAYLADLLAWGAIGARTTQSPIHRQLASGAPLPIGFKNGTDGNLMVARDAIRAARSPQRFLGIDEDGRSARISTAGNRDCHLILRGGRRPNYHRRDVSRAIRLLEPHGLARPVMIDCSHANSRKDPSRQGRVCRAVLEGIRTGAPGLLGVALESHLHPGRQDWRPGSSLAYGVSITDACIGWKETEELLFTIAAAVRSAPAAPHRWPAREVTP